MRAQAREAYRRFQQDPSHRGLRFKSVHPSLPVYSARVGLGYRAIGTLIGDTVIGSWIGSHEDYERLLKSFGRTACAADVQLCLLQMGALVTLYARGFFDGPRQKPAIAFARDATSTITRCGQRP